MTKKQLVEMVKRVVAEESLLINEGYSARDESIETLISYIKRTARDKFKKFEGILNRNGYDLNNLPDEDDEFETNQMKDAIIDAAYKLSITL